MKNLLLGLLVIYSLLLCLACPQKTALRRAAEANYQLAGAINDSVKAVETAYDQQIVSKETALKLVGFLKIANTGSIKLTQETENLRKLFPDSNKIPQERVNYLSLILSNEVVTPILELLTELKAIDRTRAAALLAAIASVKTLIIIISNALPVKSARILELERMDLVYG